MRWLRAVRPSQFGRDNEEERAEKTTWAFHQNQLQHEQSFREGGGGGRCGQYDCLASQASLPEDYQ